MDPILSVPVQTQVGLVDQGFFKAFEEGSLLRWTNDTNMPQIATPDQAWSRIATISGGSISQVVGFNAHVISASSRYADGGNISKIISPAEYNDLQYLVNLCSRNQLTVVPPAELASATPPSLTLDREGSLSVYLGRAACGEAGSDILLFRPTSMSEEEGVDTSIITGLLEPILTERTADGTILFEAYGDHHRKIVAPEEIAMLCIDLSCSMGQRCGFIDIQTNEDGDAQISRTSRSCPGAPTVENAAFYLPSADELKEYLKAHESWDDFLAIIDTGSDDHHRRKNAEKVLEILQQLDNQHADAKGKELEDGRYRMSHYHFRIKSETITRDTNNMRNRSLRLKKYSNLLCAWFISCVSKQTSSPSPLSWTPGQPAPKVYKETQEDEHDDPSFEIPRDYCCHISNEIMDDPVITIDDYTYDRRNIERWFQSNETSPLTNLILPSYDLRPDVQKKGEILRYLSASDITSKYRTLRGDARTLRVSFKSPLNSWSVMLPRDLKLTELWEIAFRLTKGRYARYELQHRNARIPPSQEPIHAVINTGHVVLITPLESPTMSSIPSSGSVIEELCLVKVYNSSYKDTIVSYWEPKKTTKTLASVIFRYYRQKFMMRSSTLVEDPFTLWRGLQDLGDNDLTGTVIDGHWQQLFTYFNRKDSTGKLSIEPCIDKSNNRSDDETDDSILEGSQPLVFKIFLGGKPRDRDNTLSRLDVLKQIFDAFINRLLAYNFQTHLGLVTFGTKASVSQNITHAVENFRYKLNNMGAAGDTALWDSLALAQDQLQHYAEKNPQAKLRVICISDGEDNTSNHTALDIATRFSRHGIVVDSFCLGNAQNDDLQTLSFLTAGYTFQPETLEEAMAICEMEPVLSLMERPDAATVNPKDRGQSYRDQFHASPSLHRFRSAAKKVVVEHVTGDQCPSRRQNPQLEESFVELEHFAKRTSQNRTDKNLRLSRIHNEIRNSGANPHPDYDIYICEPNMGLWKVAMQGPHDSTYAGGTFLLYVEMGERYPMFPPQARFMTPIYHPNINRHGRICHSIFDRNWTVDTSTKDVIDSIYALMLNPEFSDPINTVVTLNFHWDQVQFKEEAQNHIAKHATTNRTEWRQQIVG